MVIAMMAGGGTMALSEAAPSVGPYTFLSDFEGTNDAQIFSNDGSAEKQPTLPSSSDATTSTDEAKFGDTSLHLTGADRSAVYIDDGYEGEIDDFGSGEFTIQFFYKSPGGLGSQNYMASRYTTDGTQRGWAFINNSDVSMQFGIGAGGGLFIHNSTSSFDFSTKFYHIAMCRHGDDVHCYIDGVLDGTINPGADFVVPIGIDTKAVIGGWYSTNTNIGNECAGWFDDFRISKTADYPNGDDFTPPTSAYGAEPGDDYWDNVVLLLPLDGTDGDTTSTDLSDSAHVMTFVGGAELDDAQTKYGDTSLFLDGTTASVTAPHSTDFDFGAEDFTIECHFYQFTLASGGLRPLIACGSNTSNQKSWIFSLDGQTYKFHASVDGANWASTEVVSTPHDTEQWYHAAVTRESGVIRFWLDGEQQGADQANTDDLFVSTAALSIGRMADHTSYYKGHVDNIRVTNGIARYSENFTPPTEAYPTEGVGPTPGVVQDFDNVVLQLEYEGTDGDTTTTDVSTYNHTVGFASSQIDDAQFKVGNTSLLKGGGKHQAGTGPEYAVDADTHFTYEMWVRFNGTPSAVDDRAFLSPLHSPGNFSFMWRYFEEKMEFLLGNAAGTATEFTVTTPWIPAGNTWIHIAACMERGDTDTLYLFADGELLVSSTDADGAVIPDVTHPLEIGSYWNAGGGQLNGWIDSLRMVHGEALYTENFTPPTDPHPVPDPVDDNFADVSLLLPLDGADGATSTDDLSVLDHTVTFAGAAELDTAQLKFGSSSVLLDGADGTGLSIPSHADFNFGSGDYTVECFVRYAVDPTTQQMYVTKYLDSGNNRSWWMGTNSSATQLYFAYSTDGSNGLVGPVGTWNPVVDQWYHLAATREGNSMYIFADGVLLNTFDATGVTLFGSTAAVLIGARAQAGSLKFVPNGWVDGVRITTGVARYTETFTPPTEAYPTEGPAPSAAPNPTFSNVVALLHFEDGNGDTTPVDSSNFSKTWTCTSPATVSTLSSKWGTGSLEFQGDGNSRCTVDDNADMSMAAQDFCLEMWVNFISLPGGTGGRTLMADYGSPSNASFRWDWDDDNTMRFNYSTDGNTAGSTVMSAAWTPTVDTWYHVAISRDGSNLRMFVDGSQIGTTGDISTDVIWNSTRQKHIGFNNLSTHLGYQYVDEFRWTIGEPVYTENFIAPTAAFPNS